MLPIKRISHLTLGFWLCILIGSFAQPEIKVYYNKAGFETKAFVQCRIPLSWIGSPFIWKVVKGDTVFAGDKYLIDKNIAVFGRSTLPVNLEIVIPQKAGLRFELSGPIAWDSISVELTSLPENTYLSSVFPFGYSRQSASPGFWDLGNGQFLWPVESDFLPKDSTKVQAMACFYPKGDSTDDFLMRMGISAYPEGAVVGGWLAQKAITGGKTVYFRNSFNIENLPSGNYFLFAELLNSEGKKLERKYWSFQRHNPGIEALPEAVQVDAATSRRTEKLADFTQFINAKEARKALASLEPIVSTSEYKAILLILQGKADSVRQKEFLWDFWKRRDPTSPTFGFETYRDKVAEAERLYSVFRRNVWKTDRGRVFLQYGKPYQTDNETTFRQRGITQGSVPFEVWNYRSTERPGISTVMFVFIADGSSPNEYRLVHSTAPGEPNNPNWQQLLLTGNRR